jgi:hypothetical protein
MVLSLVALAARLGLGAARAGSKAAVQTVPKATGWGAYAKTGIVGGSIAAGGLGISSAIGSAQESISEGGGGLLAIGGIIAAILLILFLLLRRK